MSFHSLQLCPVTGLHLPLVCYFSYNREACGRKRCDYQCWISGFDLQLTAVITDASFGIPSWRGAMIEAEQATELQSTAHGKEGTVADAEEAANLKPGIRIHPVIWGVWLVLKINCHRHVIIWMCQSQWRPWIVWRRCRRPSGTHGRAISPLRGVMMNWSPYLRPMQSGSAWA